MWKCPWQAFPGIRPRKRCCILPSTDLGPQEPGGHPGMLCRLEDGASESKRFLRDRQDQSCPLRTVVGGLLAEAVFVQRHLCLMCYMCAVECLRSLLFIAPCPTSYSGKVLSPSLRQLRPSRTLGPSRTQALADGVCLHFLSPCQSLLQATAE